MLQAARRLGTAPRRAHVDQRDLRHRRSTRPIDEKHPLQGQSPYSASKIGADKMAESFHRSFGTPVVTIRPFNTFGPRQSARAVIPTIISQALARAAGAAARLARPGARPHFVKDTAAGFLAVAASDACVGERDERGVTGKGITIGDLAQRILVAAGREDMPIVTDDAARAARRSPR